MKPIPNVADSPDRTVEDGLQSKEGESGHVMGDNSAITPNDGLPATLHRHTIGARQAHRIHAMAHRIDAEHDQDGGHGAVVMLRPGVATAAPRVRPANQPLPSRPTQAEPPADPKPIWDKDNFGFWLTVCILISLVFSIAWHALG
ncbi:hypothetical protein ACFWZU_09400 [Frateuria sp. GZRR33]|uniref:hypothetical protein n=1 Tax=Frateuria sp. GZRR33 TaxID=3351535 RepID=UPI003EDBA39D